jgi:hypothetical protein
MAAHYTFARYLHGGSTPELSWITLSGTVAEGQPIVRSSGTGVVATGGANTGGVLGVAQAGGVSGDVIPYIPATPDALFRTSDVSAALTAGLLYGLVATSLNVDASNTTQTRLKVYEPVNEEGEYGVIFTGFLTL